VTLLATPLVALSLMGAATDAVPAPTPTPDPKSPKSAVAAADRAEVKLGEPFSVKVTVKHDPKERWSIAEDQGYAPFSLKGKSTKTAQEGSLAVDETTLTLALFQLGAHPVPDLKLVESTSSQPGQTAGTFTLPGPVIKGVAPEIEKDKQKRDIVGPVNVQVTTLRPLAWLAAAIGAAALIFLAVRLWRRRPRRAMELAAPSRPAHEIALDALSALEAKGLPHQGRFKLFHLELSEILRHYLGERYGMLAMDMTSSELLEDLAKRPTEGLSLSELAWICGQGDLAKFAKGAPTADDCKEALSLVRKNVLRTRPPEITPGAPPDVMAARKVGS
jgi:hypothetical protein